MEDGSEGMTVEVEQGSPAARSRAQPLELTEAQQADPRFVAARVASGGDPGAEMVNHAAQGATLDSVEEKSALDWLLGDPKPIIYNVPVQYETPAGMVPMTFVLRQIDARKIDAIEQKHVNQATGVLNQFDANVELIAEATLFITDPSGKQMKLDSEEFRRAKRRDPTTGEIVPFVLASGTLALERKFRMQLGLLNGVGVQIRRVAGFDTERVGKAQRRLVDASLG